MDNYIGTRYHKFVAPRKRKEIRELKYLVAIPIPFLDRNGAQLNSQEVEDWTRKATRELSQCFGGATSVPSPGLYNNLAGKVLYEEKGQILVMSACGDRDEYLAKRDHIQTFADRMAEALNQESIFVLAFPSDSFLIEYSAEGE